jgi:hypothetical protein
VHEGGLLLEEVNGEGEVGRGSEDKLQLDVGEVAPIPEVSLRTKVS